MVVVANTFLSGVVYVSQKRVDCVTGKELKHLRIKIRG